MPRILLPMVISGALMLAAYGLTIVAHALRLDWDFERLADLLFGVFGLTAAGTVVALAVWS